MIKKLNEMVLDKIYEQEKGRYRTTNVRTFLCKIVILPQHGGKTFK